MSSVYKDERLYFMAFKKLSHLLSSIEQNPNLPVSSFEFTPAARDVSGLCGSLKFGAIPSSAGTWSVEISVSRRDVSNQPAVVRLVTLHVKGGAEQAALTIDILQEQLSEAA